MRVLIIDNYDSFTFNLYQVVGGLLKRKQEVFLVEVFRNDAITVSQIRKKGFDRIVISPGPGSPADPAYFGVCKDVLLQLGKTTPVLGVCLGMQGMAYYFGGRVIRAHVPMHGKTSIITHDGKGVFKGLPQGLEVMRYHSLVADRKTLSECLEITAIVQCHPEGAQRLKDPLRFSKDKEILPRQLAGQNDKSCNEIMGLRHKEYPIEGIQFHPESFATEAGTIMVENFLFDYEQ